MFWGICHFSTTVWFPWSQDFKSLNLDLEEIQWTRDKNMCKVPWMLHWTQGLHERGLFWKGFRHSYVYKSNFSEHYVRWAVVSILVLILFFHYNCYPYPFFLLVILNVIIFCFLWEYFNSTKSCHFSSFIYSRKKPRLIKNENCLSVLFFMRAL